MSKKAKKRFLAAAKALAAWYERDRPMVNANPEMCAFLAAYRKMSRIKG